MIIIFEKLLIKYCSPVLAGLKTGNLFTYYENINVIKEKIKKNNDILNKFNIDIKILKSTETNSLIYVYRKNKLKNDVSNKEIIQFLSEYGYRQFDTDSLIKHLKLRIKNSSCFPHEIGIFLSYPLEDVKNFIVNKGSNCKLCGYWKVYCNEEDALKCFKKYQKCTQVYNKHFMNGKTLENLIVKV